MWDIDQMKLLSATVVLSLFTPREKFNANVFNELCQPNNNNSVTRYIHCRDVRLGRFHIIKF